MSKEKEELLKLLEQKQEHLKYNKRETLFPDTGPYRRELYPKHIDFMAAGAKHNQRAAIASNRCGKTLMGCYEASFHLTGDYPTWWPGKRFEDPIEAWAASPTNEMCKNILQKELLGEFSDMGTGMIPKKNIIKTVLKRGVSEAIETVYVKHSSGGTSRLDFKTYESGRIAFQGTKKQLILLDEEMTDPGIYTECLTRTAGAKGEEGIILATFTPLFGLSDVVLSFLPDGLAPPSGVHPDGDKYVTTIGWEHVPHLSESWKREALAAYAPHERDARTKGIPSLGSGAIYPFGSDDITVAPFKIPAWYERCYGMDVGWNMTSAIFLARDPSTNIIYVYSEHNEGEALPAIHASAIRSRGPMAGAIDPRSDGKSQADGGRLIDLYLDEGLDVVPADNSVESGIYKVSQMFATGQLKIFDNVTTLLSQLRVYRRNEKGKIVKLNDHACDALRYAIVTGLEVASSFEEEYEDEQSGYTRPSGGNDITGY